MEYNTELDDIDKKILRILQRDSHLTVKELAARVHLSPSPVFERQKRLRTGGLHRALHWLLSNSHRGGGMASWCCVTSV